MDTEPFSEEKRELLKKKSFALSVLKNSETATILRGTLEKCMKNETKRRRNRTTVMRQVKRMLADEDYLNEIARQRRLAAPSGAVIDETLIETIMVQIPQMSNRNILRTLSILRKKLPKEMFKTNLRKVLARRSNLLDDLFHTEYTEVVDDEGEKITMPVTSAKHLPTLISLVCEKGAFLRTTSSCVWDLTEDNLN